MMKHRYVVVILLFGLLFWGCDKAQQHESGVQSPLADTPPAQETPVADERESVTQKSEPINESQVMPTVSEVGVSQSVNNPAEIQLELQNKDPMELVNKIAETSVEELEALSFAELNLLKNAIYAAKGYSFSEDKVWLDQFFCGDLFAEQHYFFSDEEMETGSGLAEEDSHYSEAVRNEIFKKKNDLLRWKQSYEKPPMFDLSQYAFPGCEASDSIDEQQKLAAANVRIAIIKKVASFNGNLEALVANFYPPEVDNTYYLLGKLFPSGRYEYFMDGGGEYVLYINEWKMSLKRELMGINQLVKLMNRLEDFDQMELLGLYAGDIALLKNIIEAKNGKPFQGVPGWEISRLIGVTDVDPTYDPSKLPVETQVRIQMLEETIDKILHSGLGDVPKALRDGNIEITDWYPAAC